MEIVKVIATVKESKLLVAYLEIMKQKQKVKWTEIVMDLTMLIEKSMD